MACRTYSSAPSNKVQIPSLSWPSRISSNPPPNTISPIKSNLDAKLMNRKMTGNGYTREECKPLRQVNGVPSFPSIQRAAFIQFFDELESALFDDRLISFDRSRVECSVPSLPPHSMFVRRPHGNQTARIRARVDPPVPHYRCSDEF